MLPNPHIFGILIEWYALWQYIAIVVSSIFAFVYFKYKKAIQIPFWSLLACIVTLIVLGYASGRIMGFMDYLHETDTYADWNILLQNPALGTLRWYGALLFFLIGLPTISKLLKIKVFPQFLDFLSLILCLFTAIVKQACFFSGDGCYGTYTNLPWGMYFPYGNEPNILPVHPTPLYDSLFHLSLFAFLYYWNHSKHKKYAGQTSIFFFAGTAIFNIGLECIRLNSVFAFGLTLSQLTYVAILGIILWYYLKFSKVQTVSIHQQINGIRLKNSTPCL